MPDHTWVCPKCGEKNPPLTEACRNCSFQPVPEIASITPARIRKAPERKLIEANRKLILALYLSAIIYSGVSCLIREEGVILLTVIGFGLPVLALLAVEWIVPLLVASFFGLQARFSYSRAFAGAPLVILYAIVTPLTRGKNVVLPTNMPWLADFPASTRDAIPIIEGRILLWGGIFIFALMLGRLSRDS